MHSSRVKMSQSARSASGCYSLTEDDEDEQPKVGECESDSAVPHLTKSSHIRAVSGNRLTAFLSNSSVNHLLRRSMPELVISWL